jgi:hypothetical protein
MKHLKLLIAFILIAFTLKAQSPLVITGGNINYPVLSIVPATGQAASCLDVNDTAGSDLQYRPDGDLAAQNWIIFHDGSTQLAESNFVILSNGDFTSNGDYSTSTSTITQAGKIDLPNSTLNTDGSANFGSIEIDAIGGLQAVAIYLPYLPVYMDNAAAITGGLTVGQVYRCGDDLKIVH